MPESFALFRAEFGREGQDLVLQDPSGTVLHLSDYFAAETLGTLVSQDGASLPGRVVGRLAGPLFPGQYAQAGGFDLAQAIGQVETLTGGAFVQRTDGTTEALDIGIKVFAGDVVRTEGGSTLSITFADGTIFTLAEGSRMVLDELIYDPDATDNKGVFDLVQGGFVFIAGQAASTGGIEINTPAATMGIRGTTVKVDVQLRNGESIVTVSLNTDPDGGTGVIELRDLDGNLIANITQTDTKWIIEPPDTGVPPIEVDRTDLDFAQDSPLLTEAAAAFQLALSRVQQGETFVELPEGNAVDDDQDVDEGEGEGVDPPPTVPPLDETGDDGGAGESGTGNPELDGQDDPLPEGDTDTDTEDDAFLDGGEPTTPGSSGDSNPIVTVTSIRSVEDTPFAGNLGVTSNSPDVTVSLTQGAQNGQVVLLSDGTFTYIPNPDFGGTDTFIVTAAEPDGSSTESEITVLVDPVNDAPVVASLQDFGSTFEIGANSEGGSTPAQGAVAYSDVDEGATPGTWSISAAPQNATALGTISIDPTSGAWQYDLDQGAADPLAEGEQVVETYLATITDAEGASDTSTVQVTITGSNDGPVITSSEAQAALAEDIFGFNVEDPESEEDPGEVPSETLATGSVSGSFTFFDVDQGETQGQWSIAPSDANQTTFGSATIDPVTGEWLYTLDQMAADVLGNGDQATEVFIATVTDEFGATASQSITITVTGFNDAPTIEFSIEDITGTVFEEGYVAPDPESESAFQFARFAAMTLEEADATGTLTYTDPDAQPGAQASWAVAPLDATLGTMVIDEITGQWHYFLDQSAAQTLAEGEERTETFTATVTDADGGSSSQVITITVVGSNDEAQIIASPEDLAGAVAEGGALIAQGQLTFVDADAAPGEVSTWSISADGASRGTMIIDPATGAWTYSLDEALANSIGEGDQVTETYTAALTDPQGAVALQTIQITIAGENDGPVITSAQLDGTVRETGTTTPGISSISGTLTAEDPDEDGTNLNWQIAPEAGNETTLGDMSIDGLRGEWTYLLNNFAADSLALGQSVTESFAATVTDASGASQSTTVVITIEGSADAPVLSAGSRTLSEETAEIRVDLAALASDVDDGQDGGTLTYSLLNSPTQGQARIEGTELVFETAGDFDTLIEGQTASLVLNLQATDADGLSATSSISFTVIGTNGAPVFSDASVTLVEETTSTISLDLATLADDPDAGEDGTTLTYSIVNAPTAGSATLLGTVLSFDPGTDFEDLPSGESRAVTVDLRATDVDGETATATVTVTVTGTNDAPEINSEAETFNVSETLEETDSALTTSGEFDVTDIDEGDSVSVTGITLAATGILNGAAANDDPTLLGYFSTSPGTVIGPATDSGTLAWTWDSDSEAFDYLADGETLVLTYKIALADDAPSPGQIAQEVVITIEGTNDAPVAVADTNAGDALIEAGFGVAGDEQANGNVLLNDSDPDTSDTLSVQGAATGDQTGTGPLSGVGTFSGTYGQLIMQANGIWQYNLLDGDPDTEALEDGDTAFDVFTYTIGDGKGGTDTTTLTFEIAGSGDNVAPVANDDAITLDEDTTTTLDILGNDTDANNVPTPTQTLSVVSINDEAATEGATIATTNGSITIGAGGTVEYTPNANYNGTDSFTYVSTDGLEISNSAMANLTIDAVNDAPGIEGAASDGVITVHTIQAYNVPNSPGNGGFNSSYSGLPSGQSDGRTVSGFAAGDQVTFTISGENFFFVLRDGEGNPLPPFDGLFSNQLTSGTFTGTYTVQGGADETLNWFLGGNTQTGRNPSYTVTASVGAIDALDVNEDETGTFSGLGVSDIDLGTGAVSVDLSVDHGALALGTTEGLTLTDSDGSDGTLAFSGTLGDVNSALAQLEYVGDLNFSGQDFLEITVNDQGNTGDDPSLSGDATSEEQTRSVVINVAEVNDAPVAQADLTVTDEDTVLTGNLFADNIAGNDADPDGDEFTIHTVDGAPPVFGTPITLTSGATLTLLANGAFTFDPRGAFDFVPASGNSADGIDYTVIDSNGAVSNEVRANFSVTGVNDAPVAGDVSLVATVTGNSTFDNGFTGWTQVNGPDGPEIDVDSPLGAYTSRFSIDTSETLIFGDPFVADISFTGWLEVFRDGPGTGRAFGPSLLSDPFVGIVGDSVSFEYRAFSAGDATSIRAELIEVASGSRTLVFFDQTPINMNSGVLEEDISITTAGEYQIEFTIGGFDGTDGGFIGARLAIGTAGIVRNGVVEGTEQVFEAVQFTSAASDADNDILALASVNPTSALGATVSISESGDVVYDSNSLTNDIAPGVSIIDSFDFTIEDEFGATSTATASVTLIGTDDFTIEANSGASLTSTASATLIEADDALSFDYDLTLIENNDVFALEVGAADNVSLGELAAGDEILVDLSGIDLIAADVLPKISILDIENGQENVLHIDTDDLLALIDGDPKDGTRTLEIQADSYDNIIFETAAEWDVTENSGNSFSLSSTGTDPNFGGLGDVFATINIDDGSVTVPNG